MNVPNVTCERLIYAGFDVVIFFDHVLQFISHLVNQLARHRFLQVACHVERKTMNGANELLRVIESELLCFTQATSGRLVSRNDYLP